jgi:ectoine hydroxylase-related dioxygenase (phytanoyl-CoA dioxygenase family)
MLRVFVLCVSLALAAAAVRVLDASEKESFDREGYLLVRGVLDGEELENAISAVQEVPDTSNAMPSYTSLGFNSLRGNPALRRVALETNAAAVAQQLMDTPDTDRDIHVLKDAILVFEPNKVGCGWHVDDPFFWPSPLETKGADGVNVWIALSPMRKRFGGGLAIAPTSHRADWMKQARKAIFDSNRTCAMKTESPEHHAKIEALSLTFDMEPGDAIVQGCKNPGSAPK